MWPRPPAPMTTTLRPRAEHRDRLLDRVDRGQPRVGERGDVGRRSDGSSLTTDRALVSRKSAKPPSRLMPGNEPFSQCMSSPERHARHSPQVMNGCTMTVSPTSTLVTAGADLVDPAGVLVAGRVGQLDLGLLGPLALLDVQVGAAEPRRADAHDDVERAGDLRLVDLVELQRLVVRVQTSGLHAATSSWSGQPYRTCSSERHSPPLVSRLRLTSRARRSHVGRSVGAQRAAVARHERGVVGAAGQPELAAQLHAAPGVGAGREVGDAQRRDRLRRRTVAQQGLAHARLAGDQRLAPEQLAQGVQRALGLARERVGEARRRAPSAALISAPV